MFKKILPIILLLCANAVLAGELTPAEILRRADEARGNIAGQAVEWTISLTTTREDETKEMQLRVTNRGSDTLTEILTPEKAKGQKLLVSGGEMWFLKPGLSKPVPVPRRQKLLGDAATGDITSTDYAGEYDVVSSVEEKIDGVPCYAFDLKARTHAPSYDRIKYWIAKQRLVGMKAEFYSVSGKLLRTIALQHRDSLELGGKKRAFISKLTILDEMAKGKVTTLDFSAPVLKTLPQDFFNVTRLAEPKTAQ
jgi:hypothetical protein